MLLSLISSGLDTRTIVTYIVIDILVMLFSLSIHEWGHAYAAHKMGDDTARNMGRMTLNPIAHIDPLGMLMLLVVGFGWAKPVPVNPRNYTNYRKGEFIVSFAGIFMNLMLALFAALISCAIAIIDLNSAGLPIIREVVQAMAKAGLAFSVPKEVYTFFFILGFTNCALAIFNFIPVYPLDGSHIFILIFGKLIGAKAIMWLQRNGRILLYVFLGLSVLLSRVFGISIISDAAVWVYDKFVALFSLAAGLFA